jgi:hypothetical protein
MAAQPAGVRVSECWRLDPVFTERLPFNANSPADTWVLAELDPSSPANWLRACRRNWRSATSLPLFWDDAFLSINSGPNLLVNGDFEIVGAGQSPIASITGSL